MATPKFEDRAPETPGSGLSTPSIESAAEFMAPAFSDEDLALRFAELHAGSLRFVAAWNKWLIWTGAHWRFDDTMHAFNLARYVCREAARKCNEHGASIASARKRGAVEHLARSDERIAATIDQWDPDPWLLNTPDGVIDLRTGNARPHQAEGHRQLKASER